MVIFTCLEAAEVTFFQKLVCGALCLENSRDPEAGRQGPVGHCVTSAFLDGGLGQSMNLGSLCGWGTVLGDR